MEVASGNIECYEDMFKEITRKLYGDESFHDVEGSGESGIRNLSYSQNFPDGEDGSRYKPEHSHNGALAAIGLATLLQSGFATTSHIFNTQHGEKTFSESEGKWVTSEETLQWTKSKVASYNPVQKMFQCLDCDCVGFLTRLVEHWLGAHANVHAFQCPECPYSSAWERCVRMHLKRQHNISEENGLNIPLKENPVVSEITQYLQRLKVKAEDMLDISNHNVKSIQPEYMSHTQNHSLKMPHPLSANSENSNSGSQKRYTCSVCPYATDRRDLFTRHENIHREEKPFQCYVCQKQFNRADHVKKHFLRMHREYPYDLNRIRKQPPKNASGMSYYHKYNSNNSSSDSQTSLCEQHPHDQSNIQQIQQCDDSINIPGGYSTLPIRTPSISLIHKSKFTNTNSCNSKFSNTKSKKKGEKRYSCCYCSWTGVDNWCLKRHLNTHLKPFICSLCDYKAARSERLATHVLKVHNKRACGRCSYYADDQAQLDVHLQEHLNKNSSSSFGNNNQEQIVNQNVESFKQQQIAPLYQNSSSNERKFDNNVDQSNGDFGLFHYMEASESSETDDSEVEHSNKYVKADVQQVCTEVRQHYLSLDNTNIDTMMNNKIIFENSALQHRNPVNSVNSLAGNEKEQSHEMFHKADDCDFKTDVRQRDFGRHVYEEPNDGCSSTDMCLHGGIPLTFSEISADHQTQHHSVEALCVLRKLKPDLLNERQVMSIRENNDFVPGSHVFHSKSKEVLFKQREAMNENTNVKRCRKQSQPRKVVAEISALLKERNKSLKIENTLTQSKPRRNKSILRSLLERNGKGLHCLQNDSLRCSKCNSNLSSNVKLALHQLWCHNKSNFKCWKCNLRFPQRHQLILHKIKSHSFKNMHYKKFKSSFHRQATAKKLNFWTFNETVPEKNKTIKKCNLRVPSNFDISRNIKGSKAKISILPKMQLPILNIPIL